MTTKKSVLAVLGLLVAALALVAAGCGGGDGGAEVVALPSSSCTGLEYEGDGSPDYIIASDLPLQGSSRTQTEQMTAAIRHELGIRGWKAGDYNIAYQSCDDATAQAAKWDSAKCSQNANAYAANDAVIAVIGTFNSGCAAIIIPVLNEAPDGGIAMMSPANTYPCLTVNLPGGCEATEPAKYYPAGTRNYARVAPADDYQGAFVAEFAQEQGTKKVYILNDKEAYGLGVATTFRKAAESVGIEVAGFEAWDPKASSYEALFKKIEGTGADAVFLGGLIDENGAQVIKDKVAVLGPNDGAVKLYAPDGFTAQATIDETGPASAGMYMSVAGVPIDAFTGAAKEYIDSLLAGPLAGKAIDPYAIYGGQAAATLMDAIAASDGTRADVITKLFASDVQDGLLGTFTFSSDGDPVASAGATVAITVYKATDKLETVTTIAPKQTTVDAALGK
ncbi:branched-chain amino acid ABC transporter substrate-binding protein [Candidatus Deferrimicrobium sp.]|uniref:branched-chain amino acid ABC transporter substrate-binding protein n=1 Tax=Candidatus Deferrimicrobium sp. TaxID=3060586 RepID=UPI002ED7A962